MKNFNELTKQELASLNETQVDAYIDIELANQGVVKQTEVNIDFPDYLKPITVEPERDAIVYEVDGYAFTNKEDAEALSNFVGKLQQCSTTYNWDIGSEFYYSTTPKIQTPLINIKKVYSEPKYNAIKEQLKSIKKERELRNKKAEDQNDVAINYEAIDNIRENIRRDVRNAIIFFDSAKNYAKNYPKYFSITEDKEKALNTIFTVYNIQEEDLKKQIKIEIDLLPEEVNN